VGSDMIIMVYFFIGIPLRWFKKKGEIKEFRLRH